MAYRTGERQKLVDGLEDLIVPAICGGPVLSIRNLPGVSHLMPLTVKRGAEACASR